MITQIQVYYDGSKNINDAAARFLVRGPGTNVPPQRFARFTGARVIDLQSLHKVLCAGIDRKTQIITPLPDSLLEGPLTPFRLRCNEKIQLQIPHKGLWRPIVNFSIQGWFFDDLMKVVLNGAAALGSPIEIEGVLPTFTKEKKAPPKVKAEKAPEAGRLAELEADNLKWEKFFEVRKNPTWEYYLKNKYKDANDEGW